MKYRTEKRIVGDNGKRFEINDIVTLHYPNGGGCGNCKITKITDTGFHFNQGGGRDKSVQYKDIADIY